MKTIAILIMALLPCVGFARIGESREECDKRYGKVTVEPLVHEGITYLSYKLHGFSVSLNLIDSKCGRIRYAKTDYGKLEEAEIVALLAGNGKDWKKISNTQWKDSAGSMAKVTGKYLVVETLSYRQHKEGNKIPGGNSN
ncbi:MAG: hypothetical protein ACPIG6_02405 [Akkermansiaceae bacterium]